MPVASSVDIVRSTSDFAALVPEWRRLWLLDPGAKPFQRPEWLMSWWHHVGQPHLYVLRFLQAGHLVGILPLYVFADPVREQAQLLLIGAGTSDYLDGVFSPACTSDDILQGLASLAQETTWDIAHLTQLLPQSPLYQALAAQDATVFRPYAGEACSNCPASPVADLPKKVRADVRYFRNFAAGRGKLHLRVADAISWPADFDRLIQQHSARWQEAGLPGVLVDPQVLAWHREAIPLLLAADAVRFYTLSLDDVPIATLYALVDPPGGQRRTEYFYLIGHSQAHAELKPGTLLTAMASEYAAAEGVRVIDMLRGEETYKRFWHVEEVPTFGFSFDRQSLAALQVATR